MALSCSGQVPFAAIRELTRDASDYVLRDARNNFIRDYARAGDAGLMHLTLISARFPICEPLISATKARLRNRE